MPPRSITKTTEASNLRPRYVGREDLVKAS